MHLWGERKTRELLFAHWLVTCGGVQWGPGMHTEGRIQDLQSGAGTGAVTGVNDQCLLRSGDPGTGLQVQ